MKLKNLTVLLAAALCALVATNAHALVVESFTISLTTYTQNTNHNDGTNTTYAPILVKSHSTVELLKGLAKDKHAQGLWPSNSFPATAKLAIIRYSILSNSPVSVVSGTNILADVSDIITLGGGGDAHIQAGKRNNLTHLNNPTLKNMQVSTVTIDDTAISQGAGIKFFLTGLVTSSETDTKPANGVYTTTVSAKLSSGVGEGTDGVNDFVCTGTLSASGHGTLPAP